MKSNNASSFLNDRWKKFKGKLDLPESAWMPMTVSGLFFIKFMKTFRVVDLERGIALAQEAVDEIMGHEDEHKILYQFCLQNLNCFLMIPRLEIEHSSTGPTFTVPNPLYMGKGIQVLKRLSEGFLEVDPKEMLMHKWANAALSNADYFAKLCGAESFSEIDQAIVHTRQFIDNLPENDPLLAQVFCTLAEQLLQKHQATEDLTTLEEGIHAARAALAASEVDADPPFSQQKIGFFENFGLPRLWFRRKQVDPLSSAFRVSTG